MSLAFNSSPYAFLYWPYLDPRPSIKIVSLPPVRVAVLGAWKLNMPLGNNSGAISASFSKRLENVHSKGYFSLPNVISKKNNNMDRLY